MNKKSFVFSLIILLISFLTLEFAARRIGFRPWQYTPDTRKPKAYETDPTRGWRNKAGVFHTADGTNVIVVTHTEAGGRATAEPLPPKDGRPAIVLIGCSVTEGVSISDWETLGWKLQERFPEYEVLNYGTGGYSAFQALLALEEHFERHPHPTAAVIYGGWAGHSWRDVGVWWYLKEMSQRNATQFQMPYCDVDDQGRIVRYPAVRYYAPLAKYSALVSATYDLVWRVRERPRVRRRLAVWQAVVEQMQALSGSHDAAFIYAMLLWEDSELDMLNDFFKRSQMTYVNCRPDDWHENFGWNVPLCGHPNGLANSYYLERLAPVLEKKLSAGL